MNKLIIIPCHSIWLPGPSKGINPDEWMLAAFQMEGRDQLCFRDHIERGFQEIRRDENSILVISGGCTKKTPKQISEASSYKMLAQHLFAEEDARLWDRVYLEEFARDSFENVLFLICRYNQITNSYPTNITVVGFEFKRERFVKYHLGEALDFPLDRVEYLGNAPTPPEDKLEKYFEDLERAEFEHSLKHFKNDIYGVRSPLIEKKISRNPFNLEHEYEKGNDELHDFIVSIKNADRNSSDEVLKRKLTAPWRGQDGRK